MANPSWYNDNLNRDYPLVTRTSDLLFDPDTGVPPVYNPPSLSSSSESSSSVSESSSSVATTPILPHNLIVDFVGLMETGAEFDETEGHYVYLHSMTLASDTLTFRFRTNAPEAANHQVVFTRDVSGTPELFTIEREDSTVISFVLPDAINCSSVKWTAVLVTGNLADITDFISDGETIVFEQGLWQVEPGRIQSLKDSYLQSFNLTNKTRLVVSNADGCSSSANPNEDSNDVVINATCISGDVKFKEGYNSFIKQDRNQNAIIIGAGVGLGEGEPCDEVALNDDESLQIDSPYYTGGPACNEVLKSINGATGKNIRIINGTGFQVTAAEDADNKIIISRELTDFALCEASITNESSASV